jgi:hypothetical protein
MPYDGASAAQPMVVAAADISATTAAAFSGGIARPLYGPPSSPVLSRSEAPVRVTFARL